MQSACVSGHARQLRIVHGSHLNLRRWNAAAAGSVRDYNAALPALQHLSLEFDLDQHRDGDATTLASIIASALSLESLRVSFETFSFVDRCAVIHLPQLMCGTTRWEHLRRLSLQAVVTTEGYLRDFLERHAATLRSLELSNIKLEAVFIAGQNRHGSWIRFIRFLSETLFLEHIRFNGFFSNMWDEAWLSRDAGYEWRELRSSKAPVPYPADCLKYSIENFVTHDGLKPFTLRTNRDDEGLSPHNLPWVFAEDRSWKFEHHLLNV